MLGTMVIAALVRRSIPKKLQVDGFSYGAGAYLKPQVSPSRETCQYEKNTNPNVLEWLLRLHSFSVRIKPPTAE
jgi:hypothetical protein